MYDWQRSTSYRKYRGHGATLEADPCQHTESRNFTFEACVDALRRDVNASVRLPSQMKYFCEPDEHCATRYMCNASATCTLQQALHTLHTRYRLVGITEDFAQSIAALEWLLPQFFLNASRWSTTWIHPGHKTAAATKNHPRIRIPRDSSTYRTLRARAVNFADEMHFYDSAKQLFRRKMAEILQFAG